MNYHQKEDLGVQFIAFMANSWKRDYI